MLVNVSFGSTSWPNVDVDGDNCEIQDVFDNLKELLRLPDGCKAFVNGSEKDFNYTLRDGETVEFIKTTGDKG